MAGKEFVVDGAMCMCKYGAAPGKLMVTDNQFFRLNGTKLCASTMTLGNVLYPPGFGVCKINPMFPKPCVPAIVKWSGQFSKIMMWGGNPLTDKSKGTCSCGGPDCIEFMQTGQIPVPGNKQMQQATAAHQGELDAMGDPSALTEHPVDTQASLLLKEGDILVKAVKGESESFSGQTLIYEVEHYNTTAISDEIRSRVKWKVTVDGKEESLTQPGKDVLELLVKEEWLGKELCVQAYIKEPSQNVSVKTEVKKWQFPIIIDRYKMPGLNKEGTDIAADICYGFGVDAKEQVYSPAYVQQLIDSYSHKYENKELHPVLANSSDYDPEPLFITSGPPSVLQHIEKQVRAKHAKAIYTEENIPEAIYRIKQYIREFFMPLQIVSKTIADLFKSDDRKLQELKMKLFNEFRGMVNRWFSSDDNPDMQKNIMAMIDKFERNEGGIYESELLTRNIENHPSTIRYCKGGKKEGIETYIHEQLKTNKGDVSKLSDRTVYFITPALIEKRGRQKKKFSVTPLFPANLVSINEKEKGKNRKEGYTIALNDIWATEVAITHYTFDGKNYKVTYRVTLWDHFGLDLPDIQPNKPAGYLDGFRAWFILQHFLGYKPFVTKITFTKEFKGSL